MELKHIHIANLIVSAANMRGRAKVDIANILPSVRARGILVPLMVRPNGSPDTFEIVAGKRRYHAALAVAEENGGECEPLLAGSRRACAGPVRRKWFRPVSLRFETSHQIRPKLWGQMWGRTNACAAICFLLNALRRNYGNLPLRQLRFGCVQLRLLGRNRL
jgi:hypothetical protein